MCNMKLLIDTFRDYELGLDNGFVVGKVGELTATSLSHVKNQPKSRNKLGICVISPISFNHVLWAAVFCGECLFSGRENGSTDFMNIQILNTLTVEYKPSSGFYTNYWFSNDLKCVQFYINFKEFLKLYYTS